MFKNFVTALPFFNVFAEFKHNFAMKFQNLYFLYLQNSAIFLKLSPHIKNFAKDNILLFKPFNAFINLKFKNVYFDKILGIILAYFKILFNLY